MTPELISSRLALKPYTASLVTFQHISWLTNPEVMKYSEQRHVEHTERTQHIYLNSFGEGEYIWLLSVKPENTLKDIGTLTAYVDKHNNTANMGILIGEQSAWGRGYGIEAWQCVMHWLFEQIKVRKIECGTMLDNRAMRRIAHKSKMVVEGVQPQHFLLDGKPHDLLLYGRLRP